MTTEGRSLTAEVGDGSRELIQWLFALDPPFAFLLAMPFLVGFGGLLAECLRQRRATRAISKGHKANHESL
jgi:hypothetical protein